MATNSITDLTYGARKRAPSSSTSITFRPPPKIRNIPIEVIAVSDEKPLSSVSSAAGDLFDVNYKDRFPYYTAPSFPNRFLASYRPKEEPYVKPQFVLETLSAIKHNINDALHKPVEPIPIERPNGETPFPSLGSTGFSLEPHETLNTDETDITLNTNTRNIIARPIDDTGNNTVVPDANDIEDNPPKPTANPKVPTVISAQPLDYMDELKEKMKTGFDLKDSTLEKPYQRPPVEPMPTQYDLFKQELEQKVQNSDSVDSKPAEDPVDKFRSVVLGRKAPKQVDEEETDVTNEDND